MQALAGHLHVAMTQRHAHMVQAYLRQTTPPTPRRHDAPRRRPTHTRARRDPVWWTRSARRNLRSCEHGDRTAGVGGAQA